MTIWHVLLGLALFFIALQFIGAWVDNKLDRASQQIAERDEDWRHDVHPAFQTPTTRHLGKTAVGVEDREAA